MDSSFQTTTSTPSNDDGENSTTVLSKRENFLSTYVRDQAWSLPDSIIYYILKNPLNSKIYKKMIQSCKYFFIKNPLLVVKNLNVLYEKHQWNTFLKGKNVDLNRVSKKLWITDRLRIVSFNSILLSPNSLPTIRSKIYQSDVKELIIRYQKIYITDLEFLASKCEKIDLNGITVLYEDDSVYGFEKIIEVLPKIEEFYYDFSPNLGGASANVMTPETVKKLIQIPHFSIIKYLSLNEIPETFDIDTFYDYIKKNKRTRFCLIFRVQLSQQYQNRLQTIVNEIIATQNHDYTVPLIYFSEIVFSSIDTLLKLF